jgi:hypothetical protein
MQLKWIKYLINCSCGIVFVLLMREIWRKFNSNITNTGIKFTYSDDEAKLLPVLTGKKVTLIFYNKFGKYLRLSINLI